MKSLISMLLVAAIAIPAMAASLAGTWVLNPAQSTFPQRPMMRGPGGPGGGMGGPGGPGGGMGPMRAERVTIEQNGETFTFRYVRPGGGNVAETYEVSPDRQHLTITTHLTRPDGEEVTFKRVYDAAK